MASPPGVGSRRLQTAWLSRGPLAWLLLPIGLLFGMASALRRSLYTKDLLRAQRLPVPVVVVGNLVAGGAGKTPTVMAIVELLRRRGFTPGIVSRGHGRKSAGLVHLRPDMPASECGDEPLLMQMRTGAAIVVGSDRVGAGHALLQAHPEVNLIVADDGLQHLQLARDVQVLVFDERGAGNGWPLPAGPLREPMPTAMPPHSLVVYNANAATTPLHGSLARRALRGVASLESWRRGEPATSSGLQALQGRTLIAAAGLARPQRFYDMLTAAGLSFSTLPLPDHFDYATLPWPTGSADVIVTEKDAVKLRPERMGRTQVWVATLDFELDDEFETALLGMLPAPASPQSHIDHGSPTA